MNNMPQILELKSPSLTLYAFHLRNSINQDNEAPVTQASKLWEQLSDLGDKLDIPELKSLRQHLICYEDNQYSPEVEDDFCIEYLNLLHNQESSLDFKLSNNEQLDIQGVLCPFRLHDTYAIDLTLLSQDTLNLHQLNYLNPQNLLLQSQLKANLGQTLLLFGKLLEAQDNYQELADACIKEIFPKNNSIELVAESKLLGNPMFEYENTQIDAARRLHILVWFQCESIEPQHLNKVSELFIYLLWFRHKIFYVYHQSRWCVNQAKKLYNQIDNYRQKFRNIYQSPNQQIQLRQLRDDLRQIDIEYADYLHYLSEHQKGIGINEKNYNAKLENLNKLPNNDLIFGQEFLSHISSIQRQIQADLEFLTPGRERLRDIKAIVEKSITDVLVEKPSDSSIYYNQQQSADAYSPKIAKYSYNDAIKNNMPGIPSEIYFKLKQTLSDCDQLRSHERLINFFNANEKLKPWCDGLPETANLNERAERVISYLVDQSRADTQENVLLILLRLLRDQVDPVKPLYQSLSERLQELESILCTTNQRDGRDSQQSQNVTSAVILTAIPSEYSAVRTHLTDLQEEVHKGTVYEKGKFSTHGRVWDVGIAEIGAGNPVAAMEAERAIDYFKPNIILFVGVAGGIKDVALGDVVAATKVYGYESGKVKTSFQPRPDVGESSYNLIQRAKAEARKKDWLQKLAPEVPNPPPKVFVQPIAAGEKVVASKQSDVFEFLQANYGDAVAVEMEGRGLLEAAHANEQVSAIIIRGISDLISGKSKTDKDGWQEIAARHASAFAFEILAKL